MALKYGLCLGPSSSKDSAGDMCRAIYKLTGDGVCPQGSRFDASVDGMDITLGSGYGLAAGRWVENDGPLELAVAPGWAHSDRQDMAVMQVDEKARRASLVIAEGTVPEDLPKEPYTVPLYLLRIKRGSTNLLPGDVTDLRRHIPTLSSMTADGLRAYDFTGGGIDREIDRILAYGQQVIEKAGQAVAELGAYIEQSGAGPGIGELSTGIRAPGRGWLVCRGGYIPAEYQELRAMLGLYLPNITHEDERYSTWVYGGVKDV